MVCFQEKLNAKDYNDEEKESKKVETAPAKVCILSSELYKNSIGFTSWNSVLYKNSIGLT